MKNPRKSFYWRCESALLRLKARPTRTASPISAGRNAAPIIAVFSILHHYYWRYVARTASLIFPEIAYNLGSTDRKWKYGKITMKSK
jgi:hypothetical protein